MPSPDPPCIPTSNHPSIADVSAAPSRLELREAVRSLEVKLAVAERREEDTKRQCSLYRSQISQLEKQLVAKQLTDIRRQETKEDTEELLQTERNRRTAVQLEMKELRALLHSERDEHRLHVQTMQSTISQLERTVESLRTSLATVEAEQSLLRADNAQLVRERNEAEEALTNFYHDAHASMASAMEQQEYAYKLEALSRQVSCDQQIAECRRSDTPPANATVDHRSDAGSVFGSLAAANDAWSAAQSQLLYQQFESSQQRRSYDALVSKQIKSESELRSLKAALSTARQVSTDATAALETTRFELSEARAQIIEVEERLREAVGGKLASEEALRRLTAAKRTRTSATQTALSTALICGLEQQASEGQSAKEALFAERLIWSGRIRAAETRIEALRAVRSPSPHKDSEGGSHGIEEREELTKENSALRAQVGELQRQSKRHDSTVALLTSEVNTLRERISRFHSACSSLHNSDEHSNDDLSSVAPRGNAQEESIGAPGTPHRSRGSPVPSLRDQEQRLLEALDESAVLRGTLATREKQVMQLVRENESLAGALEALRAHAAQLQGELLAARVHSDQLDRKIKDDVALDAERCDAKQVRERTSEVSDEMISALEAAAREHNEIGATVLAVLKSAIGATTVVQPGQEESNFQDLLGSAHAVSSALRESRDSVLEWKETSLWLCQRLDALARWVNEAPVVRLLAASAAEGCASRDTQEYERAIDFPSSCLSGRIDRLWSDRCETDLQTPPRGIQQQRRLRSASPYTGCTPVGTTEMPVSIADDRTGAGYAPSPREPFVRVICASFRSLDALLDALAAQQSELADLRKSMFDVKTAFLAEMEAREDLEAQLDSAILHRCEADADALQSIQAGHQGTSLSQ